MTDNELFALARTVILDGLAARGMTGWRVARSFPPTHAGPNSAPTVYLFKVADKRHGWPWRKYEWDEAGQEMLTTEAQQYETTFQASALVVETTDPAALTPSDCLNEVCAIMQADEASAALRAQGVGVLRVGEVRNPYNKNDVNRYEADPSFDFVLTYRRERNATTQYAVSVTGTINRV